MGRLIHNEILTLKDEYRSPVEIPKKIPLFPSLCYFSKFVPIVIKGSNLGKSGLYDNNRWAESAYDIMHALESVGVKMHFSGMQYVREYLEPTIFIGNHMGTIETMVPVAIIEPVKPVLYVVKKELVEYPVFKHLISAREPIVVGRQNPREDLMHVLTEGAVRLRDGKSIILFPQKTRSAKFDTDGFNTLGVKLAKKNNVTVTPMAVLTDAWGNGKFIKEFGKIDPKKEVKIAFGKPIKVEGNGAEENEYVINFIKTKLTEWGRKDLIV